MFYSGDKLPSAQLFKDYQYLMRIWTHPWILKLQEIKAERKVRSAIDKFRCLMLLLGADPVALVCVSFSDATHFANQLACILVKLPHIGYIMRCTSSLEPVL